MSPKEISRFYKQGREIGAVVYDPDDLRLEIQAGGLDKDERDVMRAILEIVSLKGNFGVVVGEDLSVIKVTPEFYRAFAQELLESPLCMLLLKRDEK